VAVGCPGPSDVGGIQIDVSRSNGSNFQVLPGAGLAKLTAVSAIDVIDPRLTWSNTNLAFLSSLRCSGSMSVRAKLTSLTGLDNIVDGVPDLRTSYIAFSFDTVTLTNVTALNAYARCGATTQRPDGWGLPMPLVRVRACFDTLGTWAALCNYMRFGVCPGRPLPPQPRSNPPPSPPPPPPGPMPQCPSTVLPTPLEPGGYLAHHPLLALRPVFLPCFGQVPKCY
jgi:hypothetical protein